MARITQLAVSRARYMATHEYKKTQISPETMSQTTENNSKMTYFPYQILCTYAFFPGTTSSVRIPFSGSTALDPCSVSGLCSASGQA